MTLSWRRREENTWWCLVTSWDGLWPVCFRSLPTSRSWGGRYLAWASWPPTSTLPVSSPRLTESPWTGPGWSKHKVLHGVTLTRLGRQLVSTYIHPYYWLWPSWLLTLTLISNAGNCLITLLTLFQSSQPPRESVDEVSVKISDSGQGQQSQQSLRHPHLSPHTDRHHLQLLAEKLLFLQSKLFLKAERKNCIVYYHLNYIYDYHYMYMY